MSTIMSSSAHLDNATWPFYTNIDFEHFGTSARELSGALLLAFTPLVTDATRPKWENYSVLNQDWIVDGEIIDGTYNPSEPPRNISTYIYRRTTRSYVPELSGLGQYSPVWQLSPAPGVDTSIVNFNLFNVPTFQRLVQFAILTRHSAISEVIDTELVFGTSAPQKGLDPQSIIVLPVFQETGNLHSTIVGHVVAVIPWGLFFQNILQAGTKGIYVVLSESCGQSFTYIINGANGTFLGNQDLHDPRYNNTYRSTEFRSYEGNLTSAANATSAASGLASHCQYTITVYPSQEYQDSFQSNRPIIFTIGVLCVFAFTSFVFVIYDCFVRRRQHKVNTVAVKSNAIVSSLFPAQVRDKLFQDDNDRKKNNTTSGGLNPFKRANVDQLQQQQQFVDENMENGDDDGDGDTPMSPLMDGFHNSNDSAPIADLFPSATVLFMDIAGFTAWSSAREPSQVFILLETIYRRYENISK